MDTNETMLSLPLRVKFTTSTSASLQWDISSTAGGPTIACEANTTADQSIFSHTLTLTLRGNSSSETTIQGLLPATYYNCCITDNGCQQFQTKESSLSGLSPEEAGALGGFLGSLLTLLVALIVAIVVVSVLTVVKRKRAIARAKRRPVLRSNSKRYNRQDAVAPQEKVTTPTFLPHSYNASGSTTSLPQAKLTPLPTTPRDPRKSATVLPTTPRDPRKSATIPALKPALPLKPPIKNKKPHPLRRAKSQPFTRQMEDDLDENHIYDDAEVSFKTRRIVSRDNVAYSQADLDEQALQEYEALY